MSRESENPYLLGSRSYFEPMLIGADFGGLQVSRWRQVGWVSDQIPHLPAHILELNVAGHQAVRPTFDGQLFELQEFRPGDLAFAPAGATVSFEGQLEVDIVHVEFSQRLLADGHHQYASLEPRPRLRSPKLEHAVLQLLYLASAATVDSLLIDDVVSRFVGTFSREFAQKPVRAERSRFTPWQKRTLVEFLRSNLHTDLRREAIAATIGISSSHLSHCFTEEFGQAPHQLVIELRFEKAKELARNTELSAAEIAEQCGLKTISQLSKLFTAHTQITFSQFRALTRTKVAVPRSSSQSHSTTVERRTVSSIKPP